MTILTWRKEPPDSEGVWAMSEDGEQLLDVAIWRDGMPTGSKFFWCRIGDLPEIELKVKHRTPTRADLGRNIEVSNNEIYWSTGVFIGAYMNQYVVAKGANSFGGYEYARIIDDGQAKQAREWHLNVVGNYCFGADTQQRCDELVKAGAFDRVRVREVIE